MPKCESNHIQLYILTGEISGGIFLGREISGEKFLRGRNFRGKISRGKFWLENSRGKFLDTKLYMC